MLLRDIEVFLRERKMPPARFGREATGDSRFVFDLRDGRVPRTKTVRRVKAYLARERRAENPLETGGGNGREGS